MLWRLYLLQLMIHDDPQTAALLYERGRAELSSADEVVAGAPSPAGPDELVALIDTILRGLFEGDFAVALDRAAAFCRVQAAGASHLADDYEPTEPERASALTDPRAAPRGLRQRPLGLRRAVAARRADLNRCFAPSENRPDVGGRRRGPHVAVRCARRRDARAGHRSAGPQNASRREAALGGKRWSPGLLRPGCSSVTERPGVAFPTAVGSTPWPGDSRS